MFLGISLNNKQDKTNFMDDNSFVNFVTAVFLIMLSSGYLLKGTAVPAAAFMLFLLIAVIYVIRGFFEFAFRKGSDHFLKGVAMIVLLVVIIGLSGSI